ncbi:MAG: hypothetical protein A3K19_19635 [Lentisphaerae bacterium RIFOXYB12_FULL_65_16]|nr:MAG: hypothetical protein A3K18_31180 [Lentisphaerae bacterium RIFOXYA12_64_32]OGV92075.1 MAG: hypothetical protein A3K19_19635 [Lentisphaerae bacterium RIFOXYB12_FULL_65_16]
MDPFTFKLRLSDFCLDLLPIDKQVLTGNRPLLRDSVMAYFTERFKGLGGESRVVATDEEVSVTWTPCRMADTEALVNQLVDMLTAGAYDTAGPFLKALAVNCPDNHTVHYNYGMMLSDQGKLPEAIDHLKKAVALEPESANAWNALGIAHQRQGDRAEAQKALEESVRLDPENGYTLRNLGGLLADATPEKGLQYLQRAALLLPQDQATQYGYGLCLAKTGKTEEADRVLIAAMGLAPYTNIAELCRKARPKIAHENMRSRAGGSARMDVVLYCVAALEKIRELGVQRFQPIAFEIALLGRSGLDINDPAQKYTLKSLPGQFSGMQLVSYMYVGFKHIASEQDAGIDLSREYELAQKMFGEKGA